MSVEDAFERCRLLACAHYENFPIASRLLPRKSRKHFFSVYAFARIADDLADEGPDQPRERQARLKAWKESLHDCYDGRPRGPVFIALAETVSQHSIPIEYFLKLLSAFDQDTKVNRYETEDALMAYCENSANPVGRIILHLFGYRDQDRMLLSDHVCTALQLANHWQDVVVDASKDRIYVPMETLDRFGCSADQILKRQFTPEFGKMMAYLVSKTENLFVKGKPLSRKVGFSLSFNIRLVVNSGRQVLQKIAAQDYNVMARRPVIGTSERLIVLLRSLVREGEANDGPVKP